MQAEAGLLYEHLLQHPPAGRGVIIQARMHPLLPELHVQTDMECLQWMRGDVLELQQAGMDCVDTLQGRYAWCALLSLKNRRQMLGAIAEAWMHLEEGGELCVVATNRGGAKSLQQQLAKLAPVRHQSRAKCRLMVVRRVGEPALLHSWREAAAAQRVSAHGLWSQPGLFSWDRLDTGSALLLAHVPDGLHGEGMDLCCGYGALAVSLLQRMPDIRQLHLLDADRRALQMAERNLSSFATRIRLHWRDAVREALPRVDWIVCNPPFHAGLQRQTELGQQIVARACRSLKPGGRIWVVANRQLAYERVMREYLACEVLVQQQGFKVLYGENR